MDIDGKLRVEKVTVAKVDEKKQPIPGTEFEIPCDTVLLSVGLIPENEVSKSAGVTLDPVTKGPIVDQIMMTEVPGIFACGNVVHVNDLVDNVSRESEVAGVSAARYVKSGAGKGISIPVKPAGLVEDAVSMYFRVLAPTENVIIRATCGDTVLMQKKKKFVTPGEIESIRIPADKLNALQGGEIIVQVDKVQEQGA